MNLPKIDQPIYTLKIPSTKKAVKFRPFLVKEEKILLMAKESEQAADILSSIKQVVNNCSLDKTFKINELTIFDLEFLFLKLRCLSVDNMVELTFIDNEDHKEYKFKVDLNTVEVVFPDKIDNNIKLTETAGILMKYPSALLYDDNEFLSLTKDHMFELILKCLDKIYEGETLYKSSDYKKDQLVEFLENLNIKTFDKIQEFLLNVPKLRHEIKYKNELGNDRKIILDSLNSFFT